MQAICFELAHIWFGCRLGPPAQEEVDRLPAGIRHWIARCGYSPLESPFRPNKDELWLHLALLEGLRNKAAVLRRRLVPLTFPGPSDAAHIPESELTWRIRLAAWRRYNAHLLRRFVHHLRTLLGLTPAAPRWWAASNELTPRFWLFLICAAIFNFGVYIFFLLYNLYLLDRGYAEDFRWVDHGTVHRRQHRREPDWRRAGHEDGTACKPDDWLLRHGTCLGAEGVGADRGLAASRTAFLAGVATCLWFVCVPLVVAQLTTERNRPVAFSLTLGSTISMGVLAGLIGGSLPALFGSKEIVLLLGCGLALLAVVPLAWLRLDGAKPGRRTFSRHPFLLRFLAMLALWSFATGAFNPFFNVYFSRALNSPVEQIGWIFSVSQFCQVAAILIAPVLFRKFGLAPAVAMTQAATACALTGLGFTPARRRVSYTSATCRSNTWASQGCTACS